MHPSLRPPHLRQAHRALLVLRLIQALMLTSFSHLGGRGIKHLKDSLTFLTPHSHNNVNVYRPMTPLCRRRSPDLDSYLQDARSVLHPPAVCTSLATTLEQLPRATHGCLQTSMITRRSTRATLQAKACLPLESAEDVGTGS